MPPSRLSGDDTVAFIWYVLCTHTSECSTCSASSRVRRGAGGSFHSSPASLPVPACVSWRGSRDCPTLFQPVSVLPSCTQCILCGVLWGFSHVYRMTVSALCPSTPYAGSHAAPGRLCGFRSSCPLVWLYQACARRCFPAHAVVSLHESKIHTCFLSTGVLLRMTVKHIRFRSQEKTNKNAELKLTSVKGYLRAP